MNQGQFCIIFAVEDKEAHLFFDHRFAQSIKKICLKSLITNFRAWPSIYWQHLPNKISSNLFVNKDSFCHFNENDFPYRNPASFQNLQDMINNITRNLLKAREKYDCTMPLKKKSAISHVGKRYRIRFNAACWKKNIHVLESQGAQILNRKYKLHGQ